MKIALIGLGEVGRCYADLLQRAQITVLACDSSPAPAALELAARHGWSLQAQPQAWLAQADWVLSCVSGSAALAVARCCADDMRPGSGLIDMSTASPDDKRAAAAYAGERGLRYVDIAIMGSVAMLGSNTPLLAAGDGAEQAQVLLAAAGARITLLESAQAGDAISLKLLRSIYTKGLEALSIELLAAAQRQGVRKQLYDVLADLDEMPLRKLLEMLVRTHMLHAPRRAHEVRDASALLTNAGLHSYVLPGVQARFDASATALAKQPWPAGEPPAIEDALTWLLDASTPSDGAS